MNVFIKTLKKLSFNKLVLLISIFFFIISLTQIAYITSNSNDDGINTSIGVFIMGSIVILGGGLFEWIIWLANPLYFISLVLFIKGNPYSLYLSFIAFFLSISFSFWSEVLVSESGRNAEIMSLEYGYWFWVISITVLTLGAYSKFILDGSDSFTLTSSKDIE